jgi:hypothetical protein
MSVLPVPVARVRSTRRLRGTDGFEGVVDGDLLIIARNFVAQVTGNEQLILVGEVQAFEGAPAIPELLRAREGLDFLVQARGEVKLQDALAIGRVGEEQPERLGIVLRRLACPWWAGARWPWLRRRRAGNHGCSTGRNQRVWAWRGGLCDRRRQCGRRERSAAPGSAHRPIRSHASEGAYVRAARIRTPAITSRTAGTSSSPVETPGIRVSMFGKIRETGSFHADHGISAVMQQNMQ